MEVKNLINKNKNLSYENIKNILEKDHNLKIRLNKDNDYYMISTTNESNFENILVRQCTGIIIEEETNNIIHYMGEKTYDVVNEYKNNIIKLENINIKNCLISPYINGYIIKIFSYKGEWKFASSTHTNIKYFKINNTTLYDIFKDCVLKTFESIYDFLSLLDKDYCYSIILNKDNIYIINKVFLNTLKEEFNFNNFNPLYLFNIKDNFQKYILVEKNNNGNIIKKVHISVNDIKRLIYQNKACSFNDRCFNKICKFKHIIKPNIEENYKNYIILEKEKNSLFKTQDCKKGDDCEKHIKNKCIFKHEDDPIID